MANDLTPNNALVLHIDKNTALEDKKDWTNRFPITGESASIYTIAQHKTKKFWGCSCMQYLTNRPYKGVRRWCKHLEALGLPGNEQQRYEPRIEGRY